MKISLSKGVVILLIWGSQLFLTAQDHTPPLKISWDYDFHSYGTSRLRVSESPEIRYYLNGELLAIEKLETIISSNLNRLVIFEIHPRKPEARMMYHLGPKSFDLPNFLSLVDLAKKLQSKIIFDGTFREDRFDPKIYQMEYTKELLELKKKVQAEKNNSKCQPTVTNGVTRSTSSFASS